MKSFHRSSFSHLTWVYIKLRKINSKWFDCCNKICECAKVFANHRIKFMSESSFLPIGSWFNSSFISVGKQKHEVHTIVTPAHAWSSKVLQPAEGTLIVLDLYWSSLLLHNVSTLSWTEKSGCADWKVYRLKLTTTSYQLVTVQQIV